MNAVERRALALLLEQLTCPVLGGMYAQCRACQRTVYRPHGSAVFVGHADDCEVPTLLAELRHPTD